VHQPYKDEPTPLVRKMESIVDLSVDEAGALRALPMMVRELHRDQDLVREGDRPSQSCLLLEGFVFRYKMAGDDRRQILSLHIPGEIPDLQSLYLKTLDHSQAALTNARVGFIQHRALYDLMAKHPRLAGAFWRETLIDAAIFREWMVGMGRRKAPGRIAHFFCEMYARLDSIGLAENWTVSLPITQEDLADALGLSGVHVNRSLMELRGENLITFDRGKLRIDNWKGLSKAGEFDPSYLHLSRDAPEPV
jgi:CRP-like cAMP-binding protein